MLTSRIYIMEKIIKYGLGQQDFATMRERDFLYVDKTEYIIKMIEGSDYYFLSRPRRFGKSLFLSTLFYFFKGCRNLFEGLAIYDYDWKWEEYPVIRIDLSNGDFPLPQGLWQRFLEIIDIHEREYKIKGSGETPRARMTNLIIRLKEKFKRNVVILVDEYEKPLLDAMQREHFERYRSELADFYSLLKDNQPHIRFLLFTGITRFGHLNIFSGLNNITDISLSPKYSAICGITEKELTTYFEKGIRKIGEENSWDFQIAREELKNYYDGYHFSDEMIDVYNPYSLLNCFEGGRLLPMWIATGMTKSLFHLIRNRDWDLTEMEGMKVSSSVLLGVDSEFLSPTTLFYQTGYLTIKAYDKITMEYTLGIPNKEVRQALYEAIIPYYLGKDLTLKQGNLSELAKYMKNGNVEEMMQWLQTFFSKVPYETKMRLREDKPKAEKDFQFVVFTIFSQVCSFNRLHMEYSNSAGRSDIVVETEGYIYIFELKLGSTAKKALQQIEENGYALPWSSSGKKVFKIGATFSLRSKGLLSYKIGE